MKINKTSKEYKQLNMFIREVMREKKVSQESLAYFLNQSQANISQKLSGKVEWTYRELLYVFDLLDIDFSYQERRKNEI